MKNELKTIIASIEEIRASLDPDISRFKGLKAEITGSLPVTILITDAEVDYDKDRVGVSIWAMVTIGAHQGPVVVGSGWVSNDPKAVVDGFIAFLNKHGQLSALSEQHLREVFIQNKGTLIKVVADLLAKSDRRRNRLKPNM